MRVADLAHSELHRKVNTLLLHHLLEVVNRDHAKLVFGGRPLKIGVDLIDVPAGLELIQRRWRLLYLRLRENLGLDGNQTVLGCFI